MNYVNVNKSAEQVARAIYKNIGQKMPSIYELICWTEKNLGVKIKIRYAELSPSTLGLTYHDPRTNTSSVWVRSSDSHPRQNFTLCHEIAHIIRDYEEKYVFSDSNIFTKHGEERYCDRFAAAFLMPNDYFEERWNATNESTTIKKARTAKFFHVSVEAVNYRAKELGLIP